MAPRKGKSKSGHGLTWWHLLLLVPVVASYWVPLYNFAEPSIIGIPFFYWYQLLWVLLAAVITGLVYWMTE